MKKTLSILGIGILLVGCSSGGASTIDSSISKGNDVVVEKDNLKITKNDIYKEVMGAYGAAYVYNEALAFIADKEITDAEAIQAKVDETLEKSASMMTDGIDAYAQSAGYANGDEYIEKMVKPNAKQILLKERYINDNYDKMVKNHKIRYLKTITVNTEEEAKKIISESKTKDDFDAKLGASETGKDLKIVSKDTTTLDANVIDLLDAFTTDGIYSKPIKTTDNKFIVVYVYNTNIKDLKEDIITYFTSSASSVTTEYQTYYLKKYKFNVYEKKMKDYIEDNYGEDLFG